MIELHNVHKKFGHNEVLKGISLNVSKGEVVAILGPSGSGKTTFLRCINFLEKADEGTLVIDGDTIDLKHATKEEILSVRRKTAMVFQNYNLFKNKTALENVMEGLVTVRKVPVEEAKRIAKENIEKVGLSDRLDYYPSQLSGGQQQRIAMARAIVNEPRVLLLDEPLGALDLKLRQEMQYELVRLKKELGITFLYITHDQEEALTMSDKVVVMNEGYIQQEGSPEEIYDEPVNAFVADFIGDSNILSGLMVDEKLVRINDIDYPCIDGSEQGFPPRTPVDVVIRPEDIEIRPYGKGLFNGTIISKLFIGVHYEMLVQSEDGEIEWLLQNYDQHDVGEKIGMYVRPENIQIMQKPRSEAESAIELDI